MFSSKLTQIFDSYVYPYFRLKSQKLTYRLIPLIDDLVEITITLRPDIDFMMKIFPKVALK